MQGYIEKHNIPQPEYEYPRYVNTKVLFVSFVLEEK